MDISNFQAPEGGIRNPSKLTLIFPIIVLIPLMIMGNIFGSGLLYLLELGTGQQLASLIQGGEIETAEGRNFMRWASLIGHLSTFALPAFLTVWIVDKKRWAEAVGLHRLPSFGDAVLGILFILTSFPIAQLAVRFYRLIPLPENLKNIGSTTESLINSMVVMNSPSEVVLSIVVISLAPALGEELVFRGIIQKTLYGLFRYKWISVWVTALIFGVFHFQFDKLLPLFALGAVLGLLFLWTKNLWVPILAHAFINGIQLMAQYFYQPEIEDLSIEDSLSNYWPGMLFATTICCAIGYLIVKINAQKKEGLDSAS